jgi:hypothetical protein
VPSVTVWFCKADRTTGTRTRDPVVTTTYDGWARITKPVVGDKIVISSDHDSRSSPISVASEKTPPPITSRFWFSIDANAVESIASISRTNASYQDRASRSGIGQSIRLLFVVT